MNLDCKVEEFKSDYGRVSIDTIDRVDVVYPVKINDYWGNHRGVYEESAEGIILIWKRKRGEVRSRNKVNTKNINNLNTHQRLVIKKLRQTLAKFHATSFSCDGCIYHNEYLLKGVCYSYKKKRV